jgi:hypothetical protein
LRVGDGLAACPEISVVLSERWVSLTALQSVILSPVLVAIAHG